MYKAIGLSEFKAPSRTLLLVDRHGRFLAQINPGRSEKNDDLGFGYWHIQTLPKRVMEATLFLEDRRFWYHIGVDPLAIVRALCQNISSRRRVSGASTIAMQVVRMQHPGPRTYWRKALEALAAVFMTLRYGHEQVLKHYLKIVPYGQNIHGIAYASRYFFQKPLQDLSWAEIAFLSSIPQAPTRMDPMSGFGKRQAIMRGRRVLKSFLQHGVMQEAEFRLGMEQLKEIAISCRKDRPLSAMHFILKLEKLLQDNPQCIPADCGPLIFTTLDLQLQNRVDTLAWELLQQWKNRGASHVAAIVCKRKKPQVLAWLGSQNYFSPDAGAIDYTQVKRSPGSSLKPFLYAQALERGIIKTNTILDDLPAVARGFRNADNSFLGPLLPRQALANSRNIPALNLLRKIGLDEAYFFWERAGVHEGEKPAGYFGLSMAIGGLPVTLEQMVYAYGILANAGKLGDLIWFKKQKTSPEKRIISQRTARLITLFLSDPMARLPSFPRMGNTEYPFPVALKTGTSKGFRDAWTLAYSQEYLVGVWVGRADNRCMNRLGGSSSAALLAREILMHLHKSQSQGMSDLSFSPPRGYRQVQVCARCGLRATANCPLTFKEWFLPEEIPERGNVHKSLVVDRRNNLLAHAWTPAEKKTEAIFMDLPARYWSWMSGQDICRPPQRFSPLDIPAGVTLLAAGSEPALQHTKPLQVSIDSPRNGLRILQNPETPKQTNSLALRASITAEVPQILWYVDNKPYQLVNAPYSTRWPLQPGVHKFQIKVPYRPECSEVVKIEVE